MPVAVRWFEHLSRENLVPPAHSAAQPGEGEEGDDDDEAAARMERGRAVVEGGDSYSVLYGVSLLDGLKMRRPEEVGRLALASAIAEMEHRDHVLVSGGAQGWY